MTQKKSNPANSEPQLTFDNLKRRQSVRATFKLPQEIIELLGVIAGQLRIKQKSLLDQLIEDTSLLGNIAQEADRLEKHCETRRQKTYVLSRSSLLSLNAIAEKANVSRDILVEFSIKRLLPVIETELTKHNKRKVIFKEMQEHLRNSERIYQHAKQVLGKDDALFDMLDQQLSLAKKNILLADKVIEKGMPMEEW